MPKESERVTLELGPDSGQRLARLQERLDTTKVGVFKQSLRLLEYLLEQDEQDTKVLLEDKEGKQRQLVLFGLAE